MPRVTTYTHDYTPLVVLDLADSDLDAIRRRRGDEVRIAFIEPVRYEPYFNPQSPINHSATMILVEALNLRRGRPQPIVRLTGEEVSLWLLAHCRQHPAYPAHMIDEVSRIIRGFIADAPGRHPQERTARWVQDDINLRVRDMDWEAVDRVFRGTLARVPQPFPFPTREGSRGG